MKRIRVPGVGLAKLQGQRGLAMVEFAIGAPILLLLLLAIGEFGRMLSHYSILQQASRDAAGYAAKNALYRGIDVLDLAKVVEGSNPPRTVLAASKSLAVFGLAKPVIGGCGGKNQPKCDSPTLPGLSESNVSIVAVGGDHVSVTIRYVFVPVIGNALPGLFGNATPLNIELVATTVMRAL